MRAVSVAITLIMACVAIMCPTSLTQAHPGSGIVVDEQCHVFFADLSRGLLKIDARGEVTTIHPNEGGHWLALGIGAAQAGVEADRTLVRQAEDRLKDGFELQVLEPSRCFF